MKTIKTQIKLIALLLSVLIIFQGCTVYKSTSVTLEEAVQVQKKVQITTIDNKKIKFKRIVKRDGKYFGVKWLKDTTKDIRVFENDIKKLKIENKTMSIMVSALPIALALSIISALVFPNLRVGSFGSN